MRKLLLILGLTASVAVSSQGTHLRPVFKMIGTDIAYFAPVPGYTNINARYKWLATAVDSGSHIAQWNGVPNRIRTGVWTASGQLVADTANHDLYLYSDTWIKMAKFSDITTPTWQQTLVAGSTLSTSHNITGGGNAFAMEDVLLSVSNLGANRPIIFNTARFTGPLNPSNSVGIYSDSLVFDQNATGGAALPENKGYYVFKHLMDFADTTDYKPVVVNSNGRIFKATYWPGSGGGSLFPLTGTGTATGNVTGDLDGNSLTISGGSAIELDATGGLLSFKGDDIEFTDLTNITGQDKIIGWVNSSTKVGYINIGSGLSLSGGTLTASGGSIPINDLLAADGTASLDHADFGQEWQWNSKSSGTGLTLSSNSTAAATGTHVFDVNYSGANPGAGQSMIAAAIGISRTGTTSTNTALSLTSSGASTNYSLSLAGTVIMTEQAASGTAPTGRVTLYPKSDGLWYGKDDAGTETKLSNDGSGGLTVGTTAIASGTDTRVLYDNAGVLGEYTISGTGSVVMNNGATFVTTTPVSSVGYSATGEKSSYANDGLYMEYVAGSNQGKIIAIQAGGGAMKDLAIYGGTTGIGNPFVGNAIFHNSSNNVHIKGTSPLSVLDINGSLGLKYTSTATGITLDITHCVVEVTATGQTITLPTAVGITGRVYTVKLTASGSCTVATTSSQNIDASTTYSLASQYKYVTVQSNGANWIVIANN